MKRTLSIILLLISPIFAQTEVLTNADIIEMAQANLGKELIIKKINNTGNNFDTSAKALVELKKAAVDDEIIALILEKAKVQPPKSAINSNSGNSPNTEKKSLTPAEILRAARTITLLKDSLHPSRQALEKELLQRSEWKKINLVITQDTNNSDLSVRIGFVHGSILTHRYVFRVYDTRSGIVIAAGETTSWGSLAENLARNIARELKKVLDEN